ncbi:reverse transcriptase domain-containing protein [Tanacetum coccineum]
MQTRSSSKFIGESSTNPKRRNRRRSKQRVKPFALEETPVVTMVDQRTMAELLRAPTEGYAEAIVITSTLRYKDVSETSIKLLLFPFSIDGPARIWLDKEPPRSILTWDDLVSKFINHFFPPSKTTNLLNEISNFHQKFEETFSEAWDRFKDLLRVCPHHGFIELHQLDTFYNGLYPSDQDLLNSAAGGNLLERSAQGRGNNFNQAPTYQAPTHQPQVVGQSDFQAYMKANDAIMKNMQTQMTSLTNSNIELKSMFGQFMKMNTASSSGLGSLPSNTVPNPRKDLKAFTTRSGATGPSVPLPPPPSPSKEVDREPETITDQVLTGSTNNVPPPVVQPSPASTSSAPISSPKIPEPNPHQPPIPYPSRLNKEKLQGKDDIQIQSFLQMFKKIHFNISFSEALAHMPKFAKMVKDILMNKEKLLEIANIPVNENCSAVILKKLPEKL